MRVTNSSGYERRTERIVGIAAMAFFVLLGAGLLIGAYLLHSDTQAFVDDAVEIEGTVVGFDTLTTGILQREQRSAAVPVVRFTTPEGDTSTFTATSYSAWDDYHKGDSVTLLYSGEEPPRVVILAFHQQWGFQILMAIIGVAFILVPPLTLARALRS